MANQWKELMIKLVKALEHMRNIHIYGLVADVLKDDQGHLWLIYANDLICFQK
jgi:hypothetical protein